MFQSLLLHEEDFLKAKLDKAYFWHNKTYFPGESVEIPDDLAQALGLTVEKLVQQSESTDKSQVSKTKPKVLE